MGSSCQGCYSQLIVVLLSSLVESSGGRKCWKLLLKMSRLEQRTDLPLSFAGSFCRCVTCHHQAIDVAIHPNRCSLDSLSKFASGREGCGRWGKQLLWRHVRREDTEGSKRKSRCSESTGRRLHSVVWAGIEKTTYLLLGNRNVLLLALDPSECSHTQTCPRCL